MNNLNKLREFVRKELVFLTSKDYSKDQLKSKKQLFFIKENKNKFGKASNKEIVNELIPILFKLEKFNSVEELNELIVKIPFLSEVISDSVHFKTPLRGSSKPYTLSG